jgi:hypothetical protein
MTTPAEYLALADRVEAGESGPAIDAEIAIVAGDNDHEKLFVDRGLLYFHDPIRRIRCRWQAQPVTTSLDASDALRQRLLPGWFVDDIREARLEVDPSWRWAVTLRNMTKPPEVLQVIGRAPTEPAARTAAILRALAATQGDDHAGN